MTRHRDIDPKSTCTRPLLREGSVQSCDHCGWGISDAGLTQLRQKLRTA